MFFLWKVSNPGQFPDCSWKVSNPESLAPKLQEDWMGTRSDQSESMLIKSIRRYSSTGAVRINPGHGTKIARGLDWYTHW